jgi:electron transfer flavoprotein beta subunit
MKILVCITHVPDTTSKISFSSDFQKLNTEGIQFIIGPYDEYALARAVELRDSIGGTITVLNVGNISTEPTLRKALAIGADDAIRINADPINSWLVASQIAVVAQENQYDLILMGRESIDFNGNQVHGMVAELLGIPSISPAIKLEIENNKAVIWAEVEGGKELVEVELPLVVGCQEPIAEWKIPNMKGIMSARTKQLKVIEPVEIETQLGYEKFELPAPKIGVKFIDANEPEKLFEYLRTEAKVL